jgi:hypothetical protein
MFKKAPHSHIWQIGAQGIRSELIILIHLPFIPLTMDASGPSSKRRKLGNGRSSPTSTPQQNVRIKQEALDSPPLPQRRVVTSGSKRYLIPNDCMKGQQNFKKNRHVWSKKEADELRSHGFKPVRMFIRCVSEIPVHLLHCLKMKHRREDGMVIDWYVCLYGKVWS